MSMRFRAGFLGGGDPLLRRNKANAFSFPVIIEALQGSVVTSSETMISGLPINSIITLSVTGGSFAAGLTSGSATSFTSPTSFTTDSNGVIFVVARVTTSGLISTTTTCSITVNYNVTGSFSATTILFDATPDSASLVFTPGTTTAALSTVYTSSLLTVTGLQPNYNAIPVSILNGLYAAGTTQAAATTFTSTAGTYTTDSSGRLYVYVRLTSSSLLSTPTLITLTVGNSTTTYSVTTRALMNTPTGLSFTAVVDALPSADITSSQITLTGLEANYPIVISAVNGVYDGGASALSGTFNSTGTITTSATGTMVLVAKVTTGAVFLTKKDCIVAVGSSTAVFAVTTTSNTFAITNSTDIALSTLVRSAEYMITGLPPNAGVSVSVTNGSFAASTTAGGTTTFTTTPGTYITDALGRLYVRGELTSSSLFNTLVNCTITVGYKTGTFGATTTTQTFADATYSVERSTTSTSSEILITGLPASSSIALSTTSGSYAVSLSSGGATSFTSPTSFTTSASGTLYFKCQLTSSSSFSSPVSATLGVGYKTGTFTVNTRAPDTTPATFAFTALTGQSLNSPVSSTTITVTGLEPSYAVAVSASGGTVDAGTTSLSGTPAASKSVTTDPSGQLVVRAYVTTSASYSSNANNTITVGSGTAVFTATSRALMQTPSGLSFTAGTTSASPSTTYTSNQITVSGLEPSYTFTVSASGGTVDAGTSSLSGTFASSKSVTTNGSGQMVVQARVVSSSSGLTQTTCTVSIGAGSANFSVTTITVLNAPSSPYSVSATTFDLTATISFATPTSNGGATITGYIATSSPEGKTGTISGATAANITVSGLTHNQAYTFTVVATNSAGNSASSSASNSVTATMVNSPITASPATVSVVWVGAGLNMTATTTLTNNASYAITTAIQIISNPTYAGGGYGYSTPNQIVMPAYGTASATFTAVFPIGGARNWVWGLLAVGHSGTYSTFTLSVAAATVPGTPTITGVSVSGTVATITFTAPTSNGGDLITSYTATSSPEGKTGIVYQAGNGSVTVSGLTNNQTYTFTVVATNSVGSGSASGASSSVTAVSTAGVWVGGVNSYGTFGNGTYDTNSTVVQFPSPSNIGTDWASIQISDTRSVVGRKTDGTWYGWGRNLYYELLPTAYSQQINSVVTFGGGAWSTVSTGSFTGIGIYNGGLYTWGSNSLGQAMLNVYGGVYGINQIGTASNWVTCAAGGNCTFAINSSGQLWGAGIGGNVGDNTDASRSSPVQIGGNEWLKIGVGNVKVAIKTNGTLWIWGYRVDGGPGTRSSPVQVGVLTSWANVYCGEFDYTATKNDGTVWTCMYSYINSAYPSPLAPVQIGAGKSWASIACGDVSFYGIDTSGRLWNQTDSAGSLVQIGTGTTWSKIWTSSYGSSGNAVTPYYNGGTVFGITT